MDQHSDYLRPETLSRVRHILFPVRKGPPLICLKILRKVPVKEPTAGGGDVKGGGGRESWGASVTRVFGGTGSPPRSWETGASILGLQVGEYERQTGRDIKGCREALLYERCTESKA